MGNSGAKAKRNRLMKLVRSDNNIEELREFLAQPGVNVNIRRSARRANRTALMYAAGKGSSQCVKVLLDTGADVNADDKTGQTALFYASESYSRECVNSLIAAGADVNKKDKKGCTALYYDLCAGRKVCIDVQLNAGADVAMAGPRISKLLIPALKIGRDKIVAQLIEAGVDVNDFVESDDRARGTYNFDDSDHHARGTSNPLIIVAEYGAWSGGHNKHTRATKCAQFLLKAGVHVNKKFKNLNALAWYCYNPEGSAMMWYLDQKFRLLDETFIKLLYAAGEAVQWPVLEHLAGRRALADAGAVRRRKKCGNLKDLCRVLIRTHLLNLDLHSNLFIRVPKLRLPEPITQYLLYDMTLEPVYQNEPDSSSQSPLPGECCIS